MILCERGGKIQDPRPVAPPLYMLLQTRNLSPHHHICCSRPTTCRPTTKGRAGLGPLFFKDSSRWGLCSEEVCEFVGFL